MSVNLTPPPLPPPSVGVDQASRLIGVRPPGPHVRCSHSQWKTTRLHHKCAKEQLQGFSPEGQRSRRRCQLTESRGVKVERRALFLWLQGAQLYIRSIISEGREAEDVFVTHEEAEAAEVKLSPASGGKQELYA